MVVVIISIGNLNSASSRAKNQIDGNCLPEQKIWELNSFAFSFPMMSVEISSGVQWNPYLDSYLSSSSLLKI